MGRGRPSQGLSNKAVAVKLDDETLQALAAFSEDNTGGNMSEAVRLLLKKALMGRALSGLAGEMKDTGYNAGVRLGLHDFRVAMKNAAAKLWR